MESGALEKMLINILVKVMMGDNKYEGCIDRKMYEI
jgi:hypothetical protein